jgi:bacterioferritin-associated ferredoxin
MTNLFETDPVHPSELHAGSVIYYADAHTYSNQYLHGLQVAKVMVSNEKSFILDNGKRFNPATGEEVTRGNQGYLYPYTATTKAMVQDAETKLFLVNEVLSIDFNALTTQQLSLIKDVARGAFTQVTALSPCGGECGNCQDTVEVAGLDIELAQRQPEVTAPIAFNDATYELTQEELDDIEDADDEDDDDYDSANDTSLDEE